MGGQPGGGTGNCPECNVICRDHWLLWAEVHNVWKERARPRLPVETPTTTTTTTAKKV